MFRTHVNRDEAVPFSPTLPFFPASSRCSQVITDRECHHALARNVYEDRINQSHFHIGDISLHLVFDLTNY